MAQAAEKAGFKQVTIMDEPTAALYATLCRKMNEINQQGLLRAGEPGYLLLVDMGAGTTDLAVCRYTVDSRPGEVIRADRIKNEIVATWPEDRDAATFGGREVDRVLEDYVKAYLTDCGLPDAMAAQMVRGAASNSAKLWKETAVSKNLNEGKRVETCGFVSGYMAFLPQQKPFPAFGREEFERMLGDRLEQFRGLVTGCLQRASEAEPEILAKGLDLVILTGGHSAWYFTEELLNGTMPGLALPQLERVQREKSRVIRLTNPQETVALGLVYSQLPFQVGKKEEPKPAPAPEPHWEPEREPQREPDCGGVSPDTIEMEVQVNAEVCTTIRVPAEANDYAILAIAASDSKVQQAIDGWRILNIFCIRGMFINLVCDSGIGDKKCGIEVQVNGRACTTIWGPYWEVGVNAGMHNVIAGAMADSKVQQAVDGLEVQDIRYRPSQLINLICAPKTRQSSKPAPVPSRIPHWKNWLLPRIKEYIQNNPPPIATQLNSAEINQIRARFDIPEHVEIYAWHDDTHSGSLEVGFAICSNGIYARVWETSSSKKFKLFSKMSVKSYLVEWPSFFQGRIGNSTYDISIELNIDFRITKSFASYAYIGRMSIGDLRAMRSYYEELQTYLRKCSVGL